MSEMICSRCGTSGNPTTATKGNILIELILWCALLIPGLIYSIWRLSSKTDVCRACGSESLVPIHTPLGKRMLADLGDDPDAPAPSHKAAANFGRTIGRKVRKIFPRGHKT
jgi:ribosomal protein L40E